MNPEQSTPSQREEISSPNNPYSEEHLKSLTYWELHDLRKNLAQQIRTVIVVDDRGYYEEGGIRAISIKLNLQGEPMCHYHQTMQKPFHGGRTKYIGLKDGVGSGELFYTYPLPKDLEETAAKMIEAYKEMYSKEIEQYKQICQIQEELAKKA